MGFLGFFISPLGQIVAKALGILLAVAGAIGIYFYVKASIIETERLRIEKQQLEQLVIQKELRIKQMNDISDIQSAVTQKQKESDTVDENRTTKTDEAIDRSKDHEASDVLKETFRNLYGVK
jgi:hypothetical protein